MTFFTLKQLDFLKEGISLFTSGDIQSHNNQFFILILCTKKDKKAGGLAIISYKFVRVNPFALRVRNSIM